MARRMVTLVSWIACLWSLGCGEPAAPAAVKLRLEPVATGLSSPLYVTAPLGDARIFIVEQIGRIRIVKNGQLLATPFLDIRSKVASGGERGLLSVAFHPSYAANGFFFVNYTDLNGDTRVERYHVSSNADVGDPASAKPILSVAQPFSNHNGGHVLFGPDGYLYIGMGDGGSGGDPQGNGQNRNTLLGDLLRIDVNNGDPYAIPATNPFVGQPGIRGEIWAWGLRNPWRFAFDRSAVLLYIADVGQNQWEEVNVASATAGGLNYGWNVMEGTHCYPSGTGCTSAGLVQPALEYSHTDGCSITGGFVYRGSRIPEIAGHYFYGDYCSGWIRSFRYVNGKAQDQTQWDIPVVSTLSSFGEDGLGELYVMSQGGEVYRIVRDG
ncbi:MAG: glucose dehydrogenase [Gemmatimonadetes bacterium]|nr:glucose dehydrogenase [Gemmatimonadota bacterium]